MYVKLWNWKSRVQETSTYFSSNYSWLNSKICEIWLLSNIFESETLEAKTKKAAKVILASFETYETYL